MNDKKPLVLIPGSINARVRERIEATFDCLSIERADAAQEPDEKKGRIQAIASTPFMRRCAVSWSPTHLTC